MTAGIFHKTGKPRGVHIAPPCEHCKGAGYTKATLLMSDRALRSLSELARILPKEPIPVERQECTHCAGTGRAG